MGDRFYNPEIEKLEPSPVGRDGLEIDLARKIARRAIYVIGYPVNEDVVTEAVLDVLINDE